MSNRWRKICERYEIVCEKFEKETGIKEGAHVRYVGIKDNDVTLEYPQYCGRPSDPRGILNIDSIYEIECTMLARSYSLVKLVGFRKETFSTSIFEVLNKDEIKKYLKVGAHVRYIGNTYEGLNFETIYEVESVEKNALGLGFDAVKLVGFEDLVDRKYFEKI